MSEFNKDILNYKIIHGRYCTQYCLDYIKSNNIKIDPNIFIYTIIDKNSKNQLMLSKINITNNIKNNEQDEDRYNRMCIHTFFGGDASETIKIKSRLAKTTCIVREKDALVPS